jgi:AraC-like DNA-binding protein
MNDWRVPVQTLQPLVAFPRLVHIAGEVRGPQDHYRHCGRNRQNEHHCLLKITLEGEGVFRDAQGDHRLPPGRCFLCHICDPATEYFYPPDGTRPWSFLYVCLYGDVATNMLRDFVQRYGPVHDLPLDHGLVPEILSWRRLDGRVQVVSPGEGARVVASVFSALFEAATIADPGGNDLVRRAIEVVGANLRRGLTVSQLAKLLGVGREHVTRSFLAAGLLPPHRYMERKRLVEACRRLKTSEDSIADIAAELGYTQAPHFCRAFQRTIGLTPSRFRSEGVIPVE